MNECGWALSDSPLTGEPSQEERGTGDGEVPSSIKCIIGHLTWLTWLCVSMHLPLRSDPPPTLPPHTPLPCCLLAVFQVITPIRAGITLVKKRKRGGKNLKMAKLIITWEKSSVEWRRRVNDTRMVFVRHIITVRYSCWFKAKSQKPQSKK